MCSCLGDAALKRTPAPRTRRRHHPRLEDARVPAPDPPPPDPPAVVRLRSRAEAGPHDPVVLARHEAPALAPVAPPRPEPVARLRRPSGQDLAAPEELQVVVAGARHRGPPQHRPLTGPDDSAGARREELHGAATG